MGSVASEPHTANWRQILISESRLTQELIALHDKHGSKQLAPEKDTP